MTERRARASRHRLTLVAAGVILGGLGIGASAQDAAPPSPGERARAAFGGGAPEPAAEPEEADATAVAQAVAGRLGVEVLDVRTVDVQGRPLVAARVMEPGGNSNAAFLVQTLVIDPESGEVVGVFPGSESDFGSLPGPGGPAVAPTRPPSAPGGAAPD
ncbi:MAG TPA: hypothetical protein VFZ01_19920 [Geminicoccaceae bacterium]